MIELVGLEEELERTGYKHRAWRGTGRTKEYTVIVNPEHVVSVTYLQFCGGVYPRLKLVNGEEHFVRQWPTRRKKK
jgi:hypothetical protein